MKNLLLTTCFICFGAFAAEAAIPVIDNAILTKKSRTQSVTADTADDQKKTKKTTEGIDCAVHEGDKKSGAKEGRKRGIAPTEDLKPFGEFKGPDALEKGFADHRDKSFGLVGEGTATQQGIAENLKLYEKLVEDIGQTKTVKGAYDQNSIVATQNGLGLNNVVMAANMFTEAFNLVNQLRIMDESSLGKITSGDTGLGQTPYQCSDGTQGRGTQNRPCISFACTVASAGSNYPEGCFASWFVTPDGRTVTYVSHPNENIYVTGTSVPEPARTDAFTHLIQLKQETPQ
jgi:hypothetical protein